MVATCSADDDCARQGLGACVDAKLCYTKTTMVIRGRPEERELLLGISGPGAACEKPRLEEPGKVCAKQGDTPTAFVPPASGTSGGPPRRGPNLAGSTGGTASSSTGGTPG